MLRLFVSDGSERTHRYKLSDCASGWIKSNAELVRTGDGMIYDEKTEALCISIKAFNRYYQGRLEETMACETRIHDAAVALSDLLLLNAPDKTAALATAALWSFCYV